MNVLVAYDVATDTPEGRRRLRRVARICEGYGQRVQYSLFEMQCSQTDFVRLVTELNNVVSPEHDSLRLYRLDRNAFNDVTHVGVKREIGHHEAWTL